jgi:2'-5' RNA ligase
LEERADKPQLVRAFFAATLPGAISQALLETQAEVRQLAARTRLNVRWTRADQLHVTLKFLGATERELISELGEELALVAKKTQRFACDCAELGAFSSAKRAHVIIVRLSDALGRFRELAAEIDARMARLGFVPETRAFVPHVTLARLIPAGDVRALLTVPTLPNSNFEIASLVLFESKLTPHGSFYAPLSEVTLR